VPCVELPIASRETLIKERKWFLLAGVERVGKERKSQTTKKKGDRFPSKVCHFKIGGKKNHEKLNKYTIQKQFGN